MICLLVSLYSGVTKRELIHRTCTARDTATAAHKITRRYTLRSYSLIIINHCPIDILLNPSTPKQNMSRGTTNKSTPPDILSAAYLEGASGKKVRTAAAASCRSNDAGKDVTHVCRNNDMVQSLWKYRRWWQRRRRRPAAVVVDVDAIVASASPSHQPLVNILLVVAIGYPRPRVRIGERYYWRRIAYGGGIIIKFTTRPATTATTTTTTTAIAAATATATNHAAVSDK